MPSQLSRAGRSAPQSATLPAGVRILNRGMGMRRIAGGLVGALALAAPAAAGADPVSPDGQAIAYSTNVSHLSRDGDTFFDVYLWNRGAFSLASPGPDTTGRGMVPVFISTDGSRVVFTTDSAMVPQDVDTTDDVYESKAGGPVQLMSTGPDDAPEAGVGARYAGASADGSRVFFLTTVPLVPQDTDDQLDVYQRTTAGVTTLVSTSRPGTAPGYHVLSGLSSDGSRVIEQTDEPLTPQDTDTAPDIYERAGGTVTLLSQGPTVDATPDPGGAEVRGVTPDARSVVFATKDRLTAGDQNDDLDL